MILAPPKEKKKEQLVKEKNSAFLLILRKWHMCVGINAVVHVVRCQLWSCFSSSTFTRALTIEFKLSGTSSKYWSACQPGMCSRVSPSVLLTSFYPFLSSGKSCRRLTLELTLHKLFFSQLAKA